MANAGSILSALLPIAGAGIGLVGGPAGMMVGASAGSLLAGGIGLFNQPDNPGVDPRMYNSYNRADYTASKLTSGGGLSDTIYNRIVLNGIRQSQAGTGQALGAVRETNVSPLLIEGIANKMMAAPTVIGNAEDKAATMDIEQELNNLKSGLQANSQAANIAHSIEQTKIEQDKYLRTLENQKLKSFSSAVVGLTKSIGQLPTTPTAPKVAQAAIPNDPNINILTPEFSGVDNEDIANMSEYEQGLSEWGVN